jgi:DNA-binding transcriptional MerR regulator
MADLPVRTASMSHLSIGEVLALLLEEFPDVTISKIRFLESQGLIDPERTPSGYRKFYDDDVELLRCILREQRENYLPLRVIKDRLDSGEIDPTSEIPRPRGIRNMPDDEAVAGHPAAAVTGADALFARTDTAPTDPDTTDPSASDPSASDPSATGTVADTDGVEHGTAVSTPDEPTIPPSDQPSSPTAIAPEAGAQPGVLLTRDELCSMASIDVAALESLESYGVVTAIRGSGGLYGEDALEIASISKGFLDAGFDARHLRGWKVAADREAGLFEQMIQPLLRQRNPQAREQARQQLGEMEQIGGKLRSALMRSAMRHHYED